MTTFLALYIPDNQQTIKTLTHKGNELKVSECSLLVKWETNTTSIAVCYRLLYGSITGES